MMKEKRTSACLDPVLILPDRRRYFHETGKSAMSSFVSLYLVMLAFFVVITAAASFDRTRGTTVLRAVSGAFSSVMPVGADWSRGFPVRPGAVAGTVLQDLDRLLSEGGFTANEKQDLQGDIAMTAQTTALFQDQDVRFKPERRAMLDRLAQALAKVPGAQVTFLIGDQDPLARKRAVFLDDHWPLIAPRTPAAIGIVPGETGLTIRVRVPDAA